MCTLNDDEAWCMEIITTLTRRCIAIGRGLDEEEGKQRDRNETRRRQRRRKREEITGEARRSRSNLMTGHTSLNARLAKVIINANCKVIKHRCAFVVPRLSGSLNLPTRANHCDFFPLTSRVIPVYRHSNKIAGSHTRTEKMYAVKSKIKIEKNFLGQC